MNLRTWRGGQRTRRRARWRKQRTEPNLRRSCRALRTIQRSH